MRVENWDDARYFNFLRQTFRRGFIKYPNKGKALKNAKHGKQYKCNKCKNLFSRTNVRVDHIIPCGRLRSVDDIERFVTTLFCGIENLQILCNPCHNIKTLTDKGYTESDIKLKNFRKLKSEQQKALLATMFEIVGSNKDKRIDQYKEILNATKRKTRSRTR